MTRLQACSARLQAKGTPKQASACFFFASTQFMEYAGFTARKQAANPAYSIFIASQSLSP